MGIRDAFVNQAKNAAAGAASKFVSGVADGLRAGLGGSTSSSASSPLQSGFGKKPAVLLYPSDVGINPRQASYILFTRHSVTGAKVKPLSKAPKVATIFKTSNAGASDIGGGQGQLVPDDDATRKARAESDRNHEAKAGRVAGRGGANKDGSTTSLVLQQRSIKKTGSTIGLYMPPAVNVKYNMDYSEGEIGMVGEALYSLFKSYQDDVGFSEAMTKAAATAAQGLIKMGVGMIDKLIPGAKDLVAIERGTILTPRTEMMFRGIGRREFSFSFTFIPKSDTESKDVHNIVQEFKEGMTPTFKLAGSTREMTIPDVFSIQYMHISGPNNYINKIGKCYLKSMDVTYGGDKFVTYNADAKGAPPQRTTISLAFHELEVLDRANVKDGF
jgi:hypothetical protein